MAKLNKKSFLQLFDQDVPYIALKVEIDGFEPDLVVHTQANFEHYKEIYNNDYFETNRGLESKHGVARIVDACIAKDLNNIHIMLKI